MAFCFPAEAANVEPINVTAAIGDEIEFSLKTRDPKVAKTRSGLAQAQFEEFCEGVRRGSAHLTHEKVIALSGVWSRRWVARLCETPGPP